MEIILISIHLTWKEVKTIYCTNKQFNPLNMERRPLYLKTQSVPRCKRFYSRL